MIEVIVSVPNVVGLPEDHKFYIFRVEGDALKDSVNRYAIRSQIPGGPRAEFEHRYGDGYEYCVARAFMALKRATLHEHRR